MKLKFTDPFTGLNEEEVRQSKSNAIKEELQISTKKIVQTHIFSLFNLINLLLAFLVFLTGEQRNMLFMGVVITNAGIGIVQSLRSKKKLDALTLLNKQKACVLRGGKEYRVDFDDVVQNDIVILSAGDQICVDGVLVEGCIECNESMLTGESESIEKKTGSRLFAGSFVVAGKARMQALQVAEDTYVHSVLRHVKRPKKYPSQLRDSIDAIVRFSTVILIPAGVFLYGKAVFFTGSTWQDAILSMAAALVGMIPEGLVILTSIALAMGAYELAQKNVLVHELYCLETLARVDVLCLDKTGTLTRGKMQVADILPQHKLPVSEIRTILGKMFSVLPDTNATAMAIRDHVPAVSCTAKKVIPFSSDRKASAVVFEDAAYVIGAYSFMVRHPDPMVEKQLEMYTRQGIRVLALCRARGELSASLRGDHELLAWILIRDTLRENIQKILSYFKEQNVKIKILSGDDVHTVCGIARQAGMDADGMDMSDEMADVEDVFRYDVFGRVTPEQKRDMIRALQKKGHTVAMIGDGVNDVMALKEADCSIAMGSGVEAAKNIASIVLLEDQFDAMPAILDRGRRVINNIQRTASLFLVKTLLSMGSSVFNLFFLPYYPFIPIQLTLIFALATGIPSFILTLEPNHARVKGNFLKNVFAKAVPGGLCSLLAILGVHIFTMVTQQDASREQFTTMCTLLAGCSSLSVLISVCKPMTRLRLGLVALMIVCFLFCILFGPLQSWFCIDLDLLNAAQRWYLLGNIPFIFILVQVLARRMDIK